MKAEAGAVIRILGIDSGLRITGFGSGRARGALDRRCQSACTETCGKVCAEV